MMRTSILLVISAYFFCMAIGYAYDDEDPISLLPGPGIEILDTSQNPTGVVWFHVETDKLVLEFSGRDYDIFPPGAPFEGQPYRNDALPVSVFEGLGSTWERSSIAFKCRFPFGKRTVWKAVEKTDQAVTITCYPKDTVYQVHYKEPWISADDPDPDPINFGPFKAFIVGCDLNVHTDSSGSGESLIRNWENTYSQENPPTVTHSFAFNQTIPEGTEGTEEITRYLLGRYTLRTDPSGADLAGRTITCPFSAKDTGSLSASATDEDIADAVSSIAFGIQFNNFPLAPSIAINFEIPDDCEAAAGGEYKFNNSTFNRELKVSSCGKEGTVTSQTFLSYYPGSITNTLTGISGTDYEHSFALGIKLESKEVGPICPRPEPHSCSPSFCPVMYDYSEVQVTSTLEPTLSMGRPSLAGEAFNEDEEDW